MPTEPKTNQKDEKGEPKTSIGVLTKFTGPDDFFVKLNTGDVIERLKARITGAWVYHLKIGEKHIFNLGVDGSLETATALAQMSGGQFLVRSKDVKKIEWSPDKLYVSATVEVGLFTKGIHPVTQQIIDVELNNAFGHFRQWTTIVRKADGKIVPVQQPETQAVGKAERNARNKLIPKKLRDAIIKEARVLKLVEEEEEEKGSRRSTRTKRPGSSEKPASKEQINTLGDLLQSEFVPQAMKDTLDKLTSEGKLTESQATSWIATMEKKIEDGERNQKNKNPEGKVDPKFF